MRFPQPYRARPARRDDLDALVALLEARDLADVGFVDQAREEIVDDWATPTVELERDSVVVEDADGSLVAYGIVVAIDPTAQLRGIGRVHPDHEGRGLGSALQLDLERRATERLPHDVAAPFRVDIPEQDLEGRDLLLAAGYRHVRSGWLMQMALPADVPPQADPAGVALRAATVDDERAMHAVIEESFRDHFSFEPFPYDQWHEWVGASSGYDPSTCVLAWSADEVVGAAVNFTSGDGIGWVGDLGVLAAWRGRGVGKALLLRSFAVLDAAGHHEVRLGVDTENASGATHLYRGVGMAVRRRFDVYERQLSGA